LNQASESAAQELDGTILVTSTDEINRLRKIMGRQYDSIDQLKKSLQDLGSESLSSQSGNKTQMEIFGNKVQLLQHEQEQMTMCINVLDRENQRLKEIISQTQDGGKSLGVLLESQTVSEDSSSPEGRDLENELLEAENLIRALSQTNKEQQAAIKILESEVQSLSDHSKEANASRLDIDDDGRQNTRNDDVETLKTELIDSTNTIKKLVQTNKEQSQCISILESESDAQNNSLIAKTDLTEDVMLSDAGADASEQKSAQIENLVEFERVKSDLNAKIAEFELLEMDYLAVKQKYNTLSQEKRG
jgi:hypothetical protein